MCEVTDAENSLKGKAADGGTKPKVEVLDCDSPDESSFPMEIWDNGASSSGSNVRSSLIGMGFKPFLVDKAIEENGDSSIEVLLEALLLYSDIKPKSEEPSDGVLSYSRESLANTRVEPCRSNSSDSLDRMFSGNDGTTSPASYSRDVHVKEEDGICAGIGDEKRASLMKMSFSSNEIEFAMDKLGEDAPISELVDFIFAARIARSCERDGDAPMQSGKESRKGCDPETLFGTMEKTLRLIEMGFSENEISAVIDRLGSEVSVQVLADAIVSYQSYGEHWVQNFPSIVKVEDCSPSNCNYGNLGPLEKLKGKRPTEEYLDELSTLKRPKQEYDDLSAPSVPAWREARNAIRMSSGGYGVLASRRRHKAENVDMNRMHQSSVPKSFKSLDSKVAEPPYFFYGNVTSMSEDSWIKVSQFLYDIQPESVNTGLFSALEREEGYVHNLPTQDRFHLEPKAPMSIEETMPHTKKWWPSWDPRKQLNCINCEASKAIQVCDRLGRMLTATRGVLSSQQQREILHHCHVYNLMWVGKHQLAPIEPEIVERILGFPPSHTRCASVSLTERLESLRSSFQVETLAYHLSVLKFLYPEGMTVLSIYSGVGGAEIALDKLGIRLKAVVSVEPSDSKRRILKQWWKNSHQSGELLQIDGIRMLSSTRFDSLMHRFGKFDLVICQHPPAESPKSSKLTPDEDFDFGSFCELVRIIQRVRS